MEQQIPGSAAVNPRRPRNDVRRVTVFPATGSRLALNSARLPLSAVGFVAPAGFPRAGVAPTIGTLCVRVL